MPCINGEQLNAVTQSHLNPNQPLTRYERSRILKKVRELLDTRREEFAQLITAEANLCLRETVSVIAAITLFNYPLNQFVHELAPASAAGAPVIFKPS